MQLRGFCSDSAVDSLFIPRNSRNGQVTYVSNKGNTVSYDNEKLLWSFSKHGSEVTGTHRVQKFPFALENRRGQSRMTQMRAAANLILDN